MLPSDIKKSKGFFSRALAPIYQSYLALMKTKIRIPPQKYYLNHLCHNKILILSVFVLYFISLQDSDVHQPKCILVLRTILEQCLKTSTWFIFTCFCINIVGGVKLTRYITCKCFHTINTRVWLAILVINSDHRYDSRDTEKYKYPENVLANFLHRTKSLFWKGKKIKF